MSSRLICCGNVLVMFIASGMNRKKPVPAFVPQEPEETPTRMPRHQHGSGKRGGATGVMKNVFDPVSNVGLRIVDRERRSRSRRANPALRARPEIDDTGWWRVELFEVDHHRVNVDGKEDMDRTPTS